MLLLGKLERPGYMECLGLFWRESVLVAVYAETRGKPF